MSYKLTGSPGSLIKTNNMKLPQMHELIEFENFPSRIPEHNHSTFDPKGCKVHWYQSNSTFSSLSAELLGKLERAFLKAGLLTCKKEIAQHALFRRQHLCSSPENSRIGHVLA